MVGGVPSPVPRMFVFICYKFQEVSVKLQDSWHSELKNNNNKKKKKKKKEEYVHLL